VGLIDSDYQGQLMVSTWNRGHASFKLVTDGTTSQSVTRANRAGRVGYSWTNLFRAIEALEDLVVPVNHRTLSKK
jgi:hypothetical protein